jgi:predicted RecB family endonuclease
MTTIALREKLHKFIDSIEEKKVKAIYTLFENEIEQEVEYSDEFKAELDKRLEYYKNGGKTVSPSEMKKRLKAIRTKG